MFLLGGLRSEFEHHAEMGSPVYIEGVTHDHILRKTNYVGMTFTGGFLQDGKILGRMSSSWRTIPRAVYKRMRRNKS